ncbi:acyl-CoA/acyl-ACP dehydrogenase [Nocardioides sp. JQ2195]|uniref:acyl-CoA dehydrogenase family protein n=1 Tax=Nocardioides sp. JQ2195 TaxID=2592334 RepID=UPI00143EE586|nr:acyl-CoA dehydrogenase family protein [Nocardioides sp. JQ2195]QIX26828.1 acyl-CoA/acyl-ACP dehydrogenase [Nocardioides sp. JQ2195]
MHEWSEDDLAVRDAVRQFVDKELRPHQDELEFEGLPPYDLVRHYYATFGLADAAAEKFDFEIRRARAAEQGQPFDEVEPDGLDLAMNAVANIELVKVGMGIPTAIGVSTGLAAGTINAMGSIEQRERWVRDLVTFDKVGAWAITEPESGSDAFGGMRSTVRPDGDDFLLSGHKTFITNGPYADTIVVYAKLDTGTGVDRRDQPVLTFVLDSGMEGLTQSRPFKKMGMASSPTGELFFDHVRLGRDRLLTGQPGSDGRASARANFVAERVGIATFSLGIIEECQRLSIEYAKQRELWGKPISSFQLIQLKLAEMEIARVNVTNMVFKALAARRAGVVMDMGEASAIKLYSSRAACEVAMEAVQLFGGNGYMAEYRVEQLARDAKSLMIYAGSNEVQVTHVAKALLRR